MLLLGVGHVLWDGLLPREHHQLVLGAYADVVVDT